MKICVGGVSFEVNILRDATRVIVVLEGDRSSGEVLEGAASAVMADVLAPMAQAGWSAQFYLDETGTDTGRSWSLVSIRWMGFKAVELELTELSGDDARVEAIQEGLAARKGYQSMKACMAGIVGRQKAAVR